MRIDVVRAALLMSSALPIAASAQLITDGGAAFTAIDSTWPKPIRRGNTIRVKNNTESCPAIGYGNDPETYRWKNRADTPTVSYLITVDAIRGLQDAPLWTRGTTRNNWKAADRRNVKPYEAIPVTVQGYIEVVKKGSAEGVNCDATAERDTDWHIALVADPSEREEEAVIVEPTPRTKRRAEWTREKAGSIAVRASPGAPRRPNNAVEVRVTGFLMLDPAHATHIRAACTSNCSNKTFYRATLWEVHPVTRIQVRQGNGWVDLMDY